MGAGVIWNTGTAAQPIIMNNITSGRFPNLRVNEDGGVVGCANHENPNFRPTSIATLGSKRAAPEVFSYVVDD